MQEDDKQAQESQSSNSSEEQVKGLSGLYQDWFLDYASYVILERAVPDIRDGLKPVHRRILHSMKEMDDGRYNKVANIIGNTMKYHPHGDASIGDALVQLGQKELLVDTQGNWGNVLTGDSSAAPRYIEARLSKFALDVVFNPKTTDWVASYDGRNKEPISLPVKFPLLLTQGVEGIAVGLASKILPHNFNELIDASIRHLQGKDFDLYPDYLTGGMMDVSRYNDGLRGGKIRLRAKIEKLDKKNLVIREIPATTTTSSLIESIVSANDKGKIKIRKIEDNTADQVEIVIQLATGISPDQTIDALYAFSNCEVSISPNTCVINDNKPEFVGVKTILRRSTDQTKGLLKLELEIRLRELMEQWHFSSLEKIFIQNRLYRSIEEAESWDEAIDNIDEALKPFQKQFHRQITKDDILRLMEIKIKRISKYNEFKADEHLKNLEDEIEEVKHNLDTLTDFAIAYFKEIKRKYGKGRERKTEIRDFENIDAAVVAASNVKLYANYEEGFIGTGIKKEEFVTECSDIDDIIVFREDGNFKVIRVEDKSFVGKNIIYVGVWKKGDDRTIYNLIYRDGKAGSSYVKRFPVKSITRDKEYSLTKGTDESKILYFTCNPNGEAEVIRVKLRPRKNIRKQQFDFDFSELAIKSRQAQGNILTKYLVSKITLKEDGVSTLGAIDIYFDESVKRLNTESRGSYLGAFASDDKILCILNSGQYYISGYDLSTHFDSDMQRLCKFDEEQIFTAVYYDGESALYYIKRFTFETVSKRALFITEHPRSRMVHLSKNPEVSFKVIFNAKDKPKTKDFEMVLAHEFIDVKSYKAKGKRISSYSVKKVLMIEPEIEEEVNDDLIEDATVVEEQGHESKPEVTTEEPVVEAKEEAIEADHEEEESAPVEAKVPVAEPKVEEKKAKIVKEAEKVEKEVTEKIEPEKPKPVFKKKAKVSTPKEEEPEAPVTPSKEEVAPTPPKKEAKKKVSFKKKEKPQEPVKEEKDVEEPKEEAKEEQVKAAQKEPEQKEETKKTAPKKKVSKKKDVLKKSLDEDEPLQFELDF
jgi:topoisomerase-4 subunit A